MTEPEHPRHDAIAHPDRHDAIAHPDLQEAINRPDLIAELARRLDLLDQLLNRLEDAERQAADASEHLMHTRRWQEETVRTIQDERARMRQRQHALDQLAERARAAVQALALHYRSLPREVHELAVELQVLDSSGFLTRRSRQRR
jgi:chromosome segregation ATPase